MSSIESASDVIILPSWTGFQDRSGPYGSMGDRGSSPAFRVEFDSDFPTRAQLAALDYLRDNDARVHSILIDRILSHYPEQLEINREFVAENYGVTLPESMNAMELRDHLGIHCIYPLPAERDGIGYVGVEFGCSWDPEHGLGVMMHMDRIVEMGGADTAFLGWIAERDAES